MIVDLGAVSFIDAAGLGALVQMRNIAHQFGKDLSIRNASPRIQRVFRIAGLAGVSGSTTRAR